MISKCRCGPEGTTTFLCGMNVRFLTPAFLLLACAALLPYASLAQSAVPDWMYMLEGSYTGNATRPEDPAGNPVSLSGKRNGKEDGFVLQWLEQRSDGSVREHLEMWKTGTDNRVEVTVIEDSKPRTETWFHSSSTPSKGTLAHGAEWQGRPALLRRTFERTPGALRCTESINLGDGAWTIVRVLTLNEAAKAP